MAVNSQARLIVPKAIVKNLRTDFTTQDGTSAFLDDDTQYLLQNKCSNGASIAIRTTSEGTPEVDESVTAILGAGKAAILEPVSGVNYFVWGENGEVELVITEAV